MYVFFTPRKRAPCRGNTIHMICGSSNSRGSR
jgi:hypothetical protein